MRESNVSDVSSISIHVLRVEDDFDYLRDNMATSKFQSTSSMWRTTRFLHQEHGRKRFQSTSSMWRTTRNLSAGSCGYNISIHVLHVEDDTPRPRCRRPRTYFNPRPPCGGRRLINAGDGAADDISIHVLRVEDDAKGQRQRGLRQISIHVLRVEDDSGSAARSSSASYFNPRPPCGGRPWLSCVDVGVAYFNPRPPCGGRPFL